MIDKGFNMTVDFMYIGSSRCGSTFLYNVLKQQKGVSFPLGKPVRFWNRHIDGGYYINSDKKFEVWSKDYYYSKFNDDNLFKGDITDGYTQIPIFRIEEIKKENPNCKIIYGIRNPFDIILSHIGLKGKYKEDIITVNRLKKCFETDNQYFQNNINFSGNIKNWKNVFNDNFYVYNYDDLDNNPKETIKDICNFLNISYSGVDFELSKKINKRIKQYSFDNEAYNWLKEYCFDNIKETEKFIDKKLNWI